MAEYVSFLDGGKTDEVGLFHFLLRSQASGWLYGNSITQRGAGANMSVDINSPSAWLIASATAMFPAYIDATKNVTVDAADPTNPRKDILVAYIDLSVRSAASSNNPGALKFKAVAGTPAGAPADPSDPTIQTAVGSGNPYIKLRRIAVAAADTTIVNADITDISTPAAYLMPYLRGGGSNTNGHLVPNVADDTFALLAATQTLTNKTLTAPKLGSAGFIADANGNEVLKTAATVASAVNEVEVTNAATGNAPTLSATGGDTNISLNLVSKGSGEVQLNGVAASGAWPSYTPTWAAAVGTPSIGNGTLLGAYKQIGKTVHGRIFLKAGSTTTFGTSGAWTFSAPVTPSTFYTSTAGVSTGMLGGGYAEDSGVSGYVVTGVQWNAAAGGVRPLYNSSAGGAGNTYGVTTPWTFANGDWLSFEFSYEAA